MGWLTLYTDTWEDIADEEDDFHISRDKVMLDGGNYGGKTGDGTSQSPFFFIPSRILMGGSV